MTDSSPQQQPSSTSHPRGIYTLFFTEMWERMSYYGMRALLILFMTAAVSEGGMGLPDKTAAAIYGLYVCAVYLVALPGGWIADRLLGAQRSVWIGGCIIALGHFVLAIPSNQAFFIGLLLVVLGTSLLKPSASSLVGMLYPEGGARRDAGFTLFYMGINLGAFIGPLVCSFLGEQVNWHYGFAAAGVGMVAGVVQYSLTVRHLGDAGREPANPSRTPGLHWGLVFGGVGVVLVLAVLLLLDVVQIDPIVVAQYTGVAILSAAVLWFVYVYVFGQLTRLEMQRLAVVAVLVASYALFCSGFEQAGSSMTLFSDRYTERSFFGMEISAGSFVSLNAMFVLMFAPVFSWMWVTLAKKGHTPSLGVKFGSGLVLLALGFLVMYFAAKQALAHGKVWPTWLIMTYLLHTLGELALSPVGLSFITKLAPARLASQTMGVWFLGASLGNLLAGQLAGDMKGDAASAMPAQFMQVVIFAGATGLVLILLSKPLKKLMGGVE